MNTPYLTQNKKGNEIIRSFHFLSNKDLTHTSNTSNSTETGFSNSRPIRETPTSVDNSLNQPNKLYQYSLSAFRHSVDNQNVFKANQTQIFNSIKPKIREKCLSLIFGASKTLNLKLETIFLAIEILDKVLLVAQKKKDTLILLSQTSIMIAVKHHEVSLLTNVFNKQYNRYKASTQSLLTGQSIKDEDFLFCEVDIMNILKGHIQQINQTDFEYRLKSVVGTEIWDVNFNIFYNLNSKQHQVTGLQSKFEYLILNIIIFEMYFRLFLGNKLIRFERLIKEQFSEQINEDLYKKCQSEVSTGIFTEINKQDGLKFIQDEIYYLNINFVDLNYKKIIKSF